VPNGRIPFRLRVGVTGHRVLADEEALAAKVREALARVERPAPATPSTPVALTVVSSLAEGADRLVAREVLAREGGLLEAPLPLPRERYRSDFRTQASKDEFDHLLGRATTVVEPEIQTDREDGYLHVGRYVVDRSDVLLALWDGLRARGEGGTAKVVEYAQRQEKPVLWIHTAGDHSSFDRLGPPLRHGGGGKDLEEFNRPGISEKDGVELLTRVRERDRQSGVEAIRILGRDEADAFSAWIVPFLARADKLALRFQRLFYRLTAALYFAAAAAVAVVAVQAFVFPDHPSLVWAEVGLLVFLVLVVFYGRRRRWQHRWLSYRFLAERFRSAFFLAAAGLGRRLEDGAEHAAVKEPPEDWLQYAFNEVWAQRPPVEVQAHVEGLREFLAERWIGEQRRYYGASRRRFDRRHRLLLGGIYAAFLTTIVAAVSHARELGGHEGSEAELFSILSLTLPAVGAALSGLLAQREYQRNSDRYRWMEHSLEAAEQTMRSAETPAAVRRAAAEAETTLLEENRDWVGVMRFHDFELA
jgi:conflict system pore-forming effector with SLATT domain